MAYSRNTRKDFGAINVWTDDGINMKNNKIINLGEPDEDADATTKAYVDGKTSVGDIKMSVRSADHDGWMKCDGRSLIRVDYPDLFAIIGTSFGSGSGTTFNLPDSRGRVLGTIGQGSGLTSRAIGTAVGEETHTMTTSEMPTHSHTGTTASNGSHTHTITDPGHTHTQTTINDDYNNSGGSPPGFCSRFCW